MKNSEHGITRGVSVYSYSGLYGVSMDLEDCLMDIHDMGAETVEILSSHVDNYPHPTSRWVDEWWRLMEKYQLKPGGYGHWADTKLYKNRQCTPDEAVNNLVRDFKIANLLGFKCLRTKITISEEGMYGEPEKGWEEYMKRALEYAEKYDVRICTEIHKPTILNMPVMDTYMEFIQKNDTKYFGFNLDFSIFQNRFPRDTRLDEAADAPVDEAFSEAKEMIPFLPYTYYCHAKFNHVDENFEETTIPYKEVLQAMIDNNWKGTLISEYEGPNKEDPDFVPDQLRRQHIMMKRILGY